MLAIDLMTDKIPSGKMPYHTSNTVNTVNAILPPKVNVRLFNFPFVSSAWANIEVTILK
ncbi:MAG TPA: hypothetical protein PKE38_00565 [Ignavibacteriaceae bacterium]|nr:hypothetical protein [Ignavibacteriaceae bacterium]